jgi:DNA polymerase kappa
MRHVVDAGAVAPSAALIRLDNTKAGMTRVDKEHVERVINEMSAGSPYYVNEQRKAECRKKRIAEIIKKSSVFDKLWGTKSEWRQGIERDVAVLEHQLEQHGRVFNHSFIHIDMDMFFAAVEEKLNPELKTKPMAVGGMDMLSTSNYLAREYGVRAGMPGFIAKRLCPDLVLVHSSFDVYRAESEAVRRIISEFDPKFESGGLDEFTLCVTHLLYSPATASSSETDHELNDRLKFGSAAEIATEIRRRIFDATQLTASAGVAPTACLAKIVGNFNKPDGQYVLSVSSRAEVMSFMATLPTRKVPGIGKAMEEILSSLGITTCSALYEQRHRLHYCITRKTFEFLLEVGLGLMGTRGGFGSYGGTNGDEDGAAGGGRLSIGHERTFETLESTEAMWANLERCLRSAHETLVAEGLLCQQVVLKLKAKSFAVHQHTKNLLSPTDRIEDLERAVREIAHPHMSGFASLRLIGVRLTDLTSAAAEARESPRKQVTLSQMFDSKKRSRKSQTDAVSVVDVDGFSTETLESVEVISGPRAASAARARRKGPECPAKRSRSVSSSDVVIIESDAMEREL